MPTFQYPRSLITQFPEEVYQNAGISTVLAHLMECLDTDKVLAVQFLRVGRVHLSCQDPEASNDVLWTGLDFEGLPVRLTPADNRLGIAYLRHLQAEVDYDAVSSFFSEYRKVSLLEHGYFDDFPTIRNGNRLVKILLAEENLWFFRVEILIAVCVTPVNLSSVPSAAGLAIVPQPVLSLACAGPVVSPAIWPENALCFCF